MKKTIVIAILATSVALHFSSTAEENNTSPFKDLRGQPKSSESVFMELDQSINKFLTKEGLLNSKGIHPFESPQKDYSTLFGDKETEQKLRELDKRNAYFQERSEHLKDLKAIRRANRLLNQKKYGVKPILVSN